MRFNYEFGDDYECHEYTYEVEDNEALCACVDYIVRDCFPLTRWKYLTDEQKWGVYEKIIDIIDECDLQDYVLKKYEDELWEEYKQSAYEEWKE